MLRPEVHQDPASVHEPDGPFFGAGKRTQKRVHQYCFNFPGRFQMRSMGPQGPLLGIAGVRILEIGRLCQHQVQIGKYSS